MNNIQVWKIIDNYFRNTENNLSLTQIDSYNTFLNLQVKKTITQFNPIRPEKAIDNIKIIIGGSCDTYINTETGIEADESIIKNDGKGIYINTPVIKYDKNSDTLLEPDKYKPLSPNECRLKNLTYSTEISMDIFIIVIYAGVSRIFKQEKVPLGRIPIMLQSKICLLHNRTKEELNKLGECSYDQGGYFIIDGKEKVIIAQERQVENQIYVSKKKDDVIDYEAEIRSVKEDSFEPARVTKLILLKDGTIEVEIPGLKKTIPLIYLFRFLGAMSDKKIIDLITDFSYSELSDKIIELLKPSFHKAKFKKNEYDINQILLNNLGDTQYRFLLYRNFLPHVGYDDTTAKYYFLAFMVKELLLTKLEYKKTTNKDNFIHKRVDISGFLIGTIFRDLYFRVKNKLIEDINIKVSTLQDKSQRDGLEISYFDLFLKEKEFYLGNFLINRKIMDEGFLFTFKNCWGLKGMKGGSCKQGIVQDLNRLNYMGYISHINRINMPLSDSAKVREPHSLHASSFGMICPYETPDGGNIGLRKNLSVMTKVSFNINSSFLHKILDDLRVNTIYNIGVIATNSSKCKIFINERVYGYTENPIYLEYRLKLLRRNGLLNIYTSIIWDKIENFIKINTDSGRLLRPVLIVDNSIKTEYGERYMGTKNTLALTEELLNNNWYQLVTGNIQKDTNIDYNDRYLYQTLPGIERMQQSSEEEFKDILAEQDRYLEDNKGVIEYIDTCEINNCLLAMRVSDLGLPENKLLKFSHSEIDPCLMLGPTAASLPLIERNQAPRNQYSCAQSKQAVGIYVTNYHNRMDTKGQIIYYPQQPLIQSRLSKYLYNNVLPQGINAIVAIASYSGYNQEDSILISKGALDRGLFRTITFKSYNDHEEILGDNTREFIQSPEPSKTINIKNGNYSKLASNGIVQEGVKIDENDVIVSKIVVDSKNPLSFYDNSQLLKKNDIGMVDKVYYNNLNNEQKYVKIRIRKEKIPEPGDKFCSRFGQKGTIGMIIEHVNMPFTKDGIVPDIIVNPHAIPSRMTIGQLLETLLGKTGVHEGTITNHLPFSDTNIKEIGNTLESYGYEKHCNEVLYNGFTGEQLKVNIFIGPTFYQRLTHQVAEKYYSRNEGPVATLNKQPVGGRSLGGGLRIGEMERDAILGHGISGFLKESMMERSDKYDFHISDKSGLISAVNNEMNIYQDLSNDESVNSPDSTEYSLSDSNFAHVEMPYSFKLLLQEIESMSIALRLIPEQSNMNMDLLDNDIIEKDTMELVEEIIDFSSDKLKHVIGKNGKKKNQLEITYSCSIYIDNTNSKIIINGLRENINLLILKLRDIESKDYNIPKLPDDSKIGDVSEEPDSPKMEYDFLSAGLSMGYKSTKKLGIVIPFITKSSFNIKESNNIILDKLLNTIENSILENYQIFIVRDNTTALFNKGALINSGVKLAFLNNCDYVVINPIHFIPNATMIEQYLEYPEVPVNLSRDDNASVLSINISDYYRMNGYPNHIMDFPSSHQIFLNRLTRNNLVPNTFVRSDALFTIFNSEYLNDSLLYTKEQKDIIAYDEYNIKDETIRLSTYLTELNGTSSINTDMISGIQNQSWFSSEPTIVSDRVFYFAINFNIFTQPFYNVYLENTVLDDTNMIFKYLEIYFTLSPDDIVVSENKQFTITKETIYDKFKGTLINEKKPNSEQTNEIQSLKDTIQELQNKLELLNENFENPDEDFDYENFFENQKQIEDELYVQSSLLVDIYIKLEKYNDSKLLLIDILKLQNNTHTTEIKETLKQVEEFIRLNQYAIMVDETIDFYNWISEFFYTRYMFFKQYFQVNYQKYLHLTITPESIVFTIEDFVRELPTTIYEPQTIQTFTFKNIVLSQIDFALIRKNQELYIQLRDTLNDKYEENISKILTFITDKSIIQYINQNIEKHEREFLTDCIYYELIGKYCIFYDTIQDTLFYIDLLTFEKSYKQENQEYGDDNELENYDIYSQLIKFKLNTHRLLEERKIEIVPKNPFSLGDELTYDYTSSPAYDPNSPAYDPNSPAYDPNSPAYDPNSPTYDPNSPAFNPNSPTLIESTKLTTDEKIDNLIELYPDLEKVKEELETQIQEREKIYQILDTLKFNKFLYEAEYSPVQDISELSEDDYDVLREIEAMKSEVNPI